MKYIKVGVTKSVDGREKSLRSERYAGAGDWRIIMFVEISDAGRLEDNIQKLLSHRRVFATYMKDSKSQKAKEVFSCQFSEVETAVKKVLVEHSMNLDGIQFSQDAKGYEFIV